MNKLLSVLLATVFSAVSLSAMAADPMTDAAKAEAPKIVKHKHHHHHHAKKAEAAAPAEPADGK